MRKVRNTASPIANSWRFPWTPFHGDRCRGEDRSFARGWACGVWLVDPLIGRAKNLFDVCVRGICLRLYLTARDKDLHALFVRAHMHVPRDFSCSCC